MQLVSVRKMIVLIILPAPLNKKWTEYWTVLFIRTVLMLQIDSVSLCGVDTSYNRHPFLGWHFRYGFYIYCIYMYLYLIQLKLNQGKRSLKPGLLTQTRHRRQVAPAETRGGAYHRPLMLATSVWNWRERRPLAPPSRKEDLMGGSNSFLLFLFSSVKQKTTPQNIRG